MRDNAIEPGFTNQQSTALRGGYNYDSTSIRPQFDRTTTIRRRPKAYLCVRAAALRPKSVMLGLGLGLGL